MKTKHFVLHSVYWVWDFQGYGACRRTTAFVGLFGKGSVLAEFCSFYYVSFFNQCIQRCIDVVSTHSTVKDLFLSTELSYMPSTFRTGQCKIVLWPKSIIPVDWCTNAPAAGVDFRGCHLSRLLCRLGGIPGNIGDLDIVKFVLADSLEGIVVWGNNGELCDKLAVPSSAGRCLQIPPTTASRPRPVKAFLKRYGRRARIRAGP